MPRYFDAHGRTVHEGRWWTLARPAIALPPQVLIAASLLALKQHSSPMPAARVVGAAVIGFTLWTLFEYAVHRWLFHQTWHPVLRFIWIHAHKPHHRMRKVEDPYHRTLHPAIAIPVLLPWQLGFVLFAETSIPIATMFGFTLGYCAYELLHYVFHATRFPDRFARLPGVKSWNQAHRAHHLGHLRANFGFTTYFWDHVFGTWVGEPAEAPARNPSTPDG
jgi:sterol desaturase/sphingolipid hydroxylase (fatty acid hydroxylase superfamily)